MLSHFESNTSYKFESKYIIIGARCVSVGSTRSPTFSKEIFLACLPGHFSLPWLALLRHGRLMSLSVQQISAGYSITQLISGRSSWFLPTLAEISTTSLQHLRFQEKTVALISQGFSLVQFKFDLWLFFSDVMTIFVYVDDFMVLGTTPASYWAKSYEIINS